MRDARVDAVFTAAVACGDILHGLVGGVQGAVLAMLAAKWLAGHDREVREDILLMHAAAIRRMVELEETSARGGTAQSDEGATDV